MCHTEVKPKAQKSPKVVFIGDPTHEKMRVQPEKILKQCSVQNKEARFTKNGVDPGA